MKSWTAVLRGEDRTEFAISIEAENKDSAYQEVDDLYPEATVLELFDPEVRAREVYDRVQRNLDDPYYDDYDY